MRASPMQILIQMTMTGKQRMVLLCLPKDVHHAVAIAGEVDDVVADKRPVRKADRRTLRIPPETRQQKIPAMVKLARCDRACPNSIFAYAT